MQLNELIEQEGIDKIALKTTISELNLKSLVDGNLEKSTRVKSLGFLVILEREYKELDLSTLRESIKLYFEDRTPDVDNVIVAARDPFPHTKRGGFSFFKWFVILGILGATWYLYTQGNLDNLVQNIETKKDIYDDSKALESNISAEEADRVSIKEDNRKKVAIETPVAPKIEESIVLTSNNATKESNDSTTVATALTAMEGSVVVPTAVQPVSAITTITINPTRGMLWFGFINIDTKVRKEFMKKVTTPFDIHDGRWLLVTGHGFVDIVSELKTVEVADRNKHYFYIDSTEIREITQHDFREMNGRRGW